MVLIYQYKMSVYLFDYESPSKGMLGVLINKFVNCAYNSLGAEMNNFLL